MADVVALHDRQHHGEIGPFHVRQMDGQQVLHAALENLRNRKAPVGHGLSAGQFHRRFQQQGQIPCAADGFREPRRVFLILKDMAGVDADLPFRVVVRHPLPHGVGRSRRQQWNVFEPWRVLGRKAFEASFSQRI